MKKLFSIITLAFMFITTLTVDIYVKAKEYILAKLAPVMRPELTLRIAVARIIETVKNVAIGFFYKVRYTSA